MTKNDIIKIVSICPVCSNKLNYQEYFSYSIVGTSDVKVENSRFAVVRCYNCDFEIRKLSKEMIFQ